MDKEFWISCWDEGRTGWLLGEPHPFLTRYGPQVFREREQVLVPLCGNSPDLLWLANRGLSVWGVELAEKAVRRFFSDHDLEPTVGQWDGHPMWSANNVHIVVADWFALPQGAMSGCSAFYDRAALIAMPPGRRRDYVAQLLRISPKLERGLLVGLSHDGGEDAGPPFSVLESSITELYEGCRISRLESQSLPLSGGRGTGQLPRFRPESVVETAYYLSCEQIAED
jgi:thiopurine S-methyltransferase